MPKARRRGVLRGKGQYHEVSPIFWREDARSFDCTSLRHDGPAVGYLGRTADTLQPLGAGVCLSDSFGLIQLKYLPAYEPGFEPRRIHLGLLEAS